MEAINEIYEEAYLKQIHEDALRVLEEVGVKCASPEIREIFEETGAAAYDATTGHIHVLKPLVEQALTTAPKRDQYWIPDDAFGVGGTAPFVYDDHSGELIPPTFEHMAQIASIVDQADEVAFMARGVLIRNEEARVMDTLIEHCRKPLYVAAVTDEGIARAEEIHQQRGGLTIQFSIINSPLNIIESMVPPFLSCVRKGLPIYVSTMPMAGLSGPYSMSGLLTPDPCGGAVRHHPGPTGQPRHHRGSRRSPLPSPTFRKNYAVDLGLISHNMANLLMEKVNKRLEIPSIQTACTTSQDKPNRIAEEEAVEGFAIMKKYGFHQMRHCFGFLSELISFSIDKLERHVALCRETGPEDAPDFESEPLRPGRV